MVTRRLPWTGLALAAASLAALSLSVTAAGVPAHAQEPARHGPGTPAVRSVDTAPWPGGGDVQTVDDAQVFGKNLSGLSFENAGVLWAVKNSPGTLYRLVPSGTTWTPDPTGGWGSGKSLHYSDGSGDPDAEGVVATQDGLFTSVERDNDNGDTSKQEILRFDGSSTAGTLDATAQWDLTADLPSSDANGGIEGISWLPDSYLTAHGFRDEHTGAAYDPGAYPGHGTGLYLVGLETTGTVYAYALNQNGTDATRVATIATGLPEVMDLEFEAGSGRLWAVCDDHCDGQAATLEVDAQGQLSVTAVYERPSGMSNINNEGFAIAPGCAAGGDAYVVWSDDDNDSDHALRAGTLPCQQIAASAAACDGVQFRAPVDGVTTSGSSYPRSELREMTDSGSSEASWSSTSGTHSPSPTPDRYRYHRRPHSGPPCLRRAAAA